VSRYGTSSFFLYYNKTVGASIRCLKNWLLVYFGASNCWRQKRGLGEYPHNASGLFYHLQK
jgi:hypothetical protein